MPKIIGSYVLERKIGSGQNGEVILSDLNASKVYKGYNKENNQDIVV